MTQTSLMTRTGVVCVAMMALAACATPSYPTHVATATPAPATHPAAPAPAPPPASPPAPPSAAPQSPAPTPAPIETQALPPAAAPGASTPPVTAPPEAAQPPPSPAQSALPPDYAPPSPVPTDTFEPSAPAPPAARVPEVRYRQTPERVVAGGRVVAARGMYRDYEVRPKDHVDAIARDLQTTRKVLVDANHLKPPYALQPGQHLKVPVAKAYEVQSGDTMIEVAKRFGVGVGELADLNDLSAKARLRPGDQLALPDNFKDHGPTRLPGVTVAERNPDYRPPVAASSVAPSPGRSSMVASSPAYTPPRPARPAEVEPATGGPYVPSPEALAAAHRLAVTRSYGPPSYSTGRPSPNAAVQPQSRYPSQDSEAEGPPTAAQQAIASAGRGRFIWPVRGDIISPFGVKGVGRRNDGIDVRSPQGTAVKAAAAGDVVYAGNQVPGFGNLVLVKHSDGWVTAYAHLDSIGVQMRQSVTQGQMLGDVGTTGGVGEPQLHFEIRYAPTPTEKARPVDPLLVLPK